MYYVVILSLILLMNIVNFIDVILKFYILFYVYKYVFWLLRESSWLNIVRYDVGGLVIVVFEKL